MDRQMKDIDLKALFKKVFELSMPNLRSYYRVVRKARVVKSFAGNGSYWADVQPLRNDDSTDPDEPMIPKVEIPILWGGPDRGVICPPEKGVFCDLEYYDGDPDYPRISNFRWHGHKAPAIDMGGFIIQHSDGTCFRIDPDKKIVHVTPADIQQNAGGSWTVEVGGDATIQAGGKASITAGSTATIEAPQILLNGVVTNSAGSGGTMTLNGNLEVDGNIHATGTIEDELGNTDHHTGH